MPFYLDSDFAPGLRWEYADEINPRLPYGWYMDIDSFDTARGIVLRLPHGAGFLPGWTLGDSMASECARYSYPDAHDAAIAADELARVTAEQNLNEEPEQ